MKRVLVAAGCLALSFGLESAGATTKRVVDPNDASGRLDVVRLEHSHGRTSRVLKHRLVMQDPWRSRALRGPRSIILIWFSVDEEHRFGERRVVVDYQKGRLTACFQIYEEERDAATVGPCDKIRAWRTGPQGIVVAFGRAQLTDKRSYRWSAETFFFRSGSAACSSDECEDEAPDGGRKGQVLHRL